MKVLSLVRLRLQFLLRSLGLFALAAGMTVDSVLAIHGHRPVDRHRKLIELYNRGTKSDPLAILYAYEDWNDAAEQRLFRNRAQEMAWCESRLIDVARMKEV